MGICFPDFAKEPTQEFRVCFWALDNEDLDALFSL